MHYLVVHRDVTRTYIYIVFESKNCPRIKYLTETLMQIKPLSVKYGLGIPDHDSEGRLVTAEFDKFYLLCGYVPNSGDGLRRLVFPSNHLFMALSKGCSLTQILCRFLLHISHTGLTSGIHLSAVT